MGIFGALRAVGRHAAAFPVLTFFIVETVLLDTVFETAVPLLLSWVIDHAVLAGRADLFLLPAALLAGGWLTSVAVQLGRDFWLARLAAQVSSRARERLAERLARLPYGELRAFKTAEWNALHTGDLAQLENLVLNVAPLFLFGAFYLVFGITAMLVTNVALGMLVLLGLPLTLLGPWALSERASAQGDAARQAETDAAAAAGELLSGQPLIRTFHLGEAFARAFRAKTAAARRRVQAFAFTANLTRRLPNLTIHAVQLVLILVGTWMALDGRLGVGELLAFNLLFANVLTAVLDLASTLGPLRRAAPALEGLERVTEAAEPAEPTAEPGPVTRSAPGAPSLRFEGVSFRYDPHRRVLEDVSFEVPAGKRTAIVGPSGSGKSTMAALVSGLYTPDGGRLWWGGVDLARADRTALLSRLGVVFQENPVFDASLRDNLVLGESLDDARLWESLEAAGLAAWVRSLPEGLDTRAGENGGFLSGGQKQRLALARALVRRPSLLLLDEATSALDPLAESHVNGTLRNLHDTTVLHITHRLPGITDYDRIVVLAEGRVAEQGTHDGLLASDGAYALLWKRQAGLVVGDEGARITAAGLRAIPLFSKSSDATLERLAKVFVSETAESGERLIRQGQPGTRFFVIARGRVEVSVGPLGKEKGIATLADGDFFGEMSLLDSVLTSAHVTASLPTVLLTLEKTTFLTFVRSDASLGAAVAATAKRRRAENEQWQKLTGA